MQLGLGLQNKDIKIDYGLKNECNYGAQKLSSTITTRTGTTIVIYLVTCYWLQSPANIYIHSRLPTEHQTSDQVKT